VALDPQDKPYAWDITIKRYDGSEETITRVAPTANQARQIGMLRSRAQEVTELVPMTREAYHRAYGAKPRRRY